MDEADELLGPLDGQRRGQVEDDGQARSPQLADLAEDGGVEMLGSSSPATSAPDCEDRISRARRGPRPSRRRASFLASACAGSARAPPGRSWPRQSFCSCTTAPASTARPGRAGTWPACSGRRPRASGRPLPRLAEAEHAPSGDDVARPVLRDRPREDPAVGQQEHRGRWGRAHSRDSARRGGQPGSARPTPRNPTEAQRGQAGGEESGFW